MKLKLCDSRLWDINLSWNTNNPRVTPCFLDIISAYVPLIIFVILVVPSTILKIRSAKYSGFIRIPENAYNKAKVWFSSFMFAIKLAEFVLKVLEEYKLVSINTPYLEDKSDKSILGFLKPFVQSILFALLALIYFKQRKFGIYTSGPIWIFLFTSTLLNLTVFYSDIVAKHYLPSLIFYPFLVSLFLLECFGDDPIIIQDHTSKRKYSNEVRASFLSQVTFWWFNSFLWHGYKHQFKLSSLWKTLPRDQAGVLTTNFIKIWNSSRKDATLSSKGEDVYMTSEGTLKRKRNVASVLWSIINRQILLAASLKFVQDCLQFTTPMILKCLLNFMSSEEPKWHGFFYASLFLIVPSFQSSFLAATFFRMQITGSHIKSILVSAIYRKSLILSHSSRSKSTTGEIINLMAVDSQRLQDLMLYLNLFWSAPLQILIAVCLLYQELGWSVFAGVATMIVVIPINGYLSRVTKRTHMKLMRKKDERIKQMNEILNGIKVIKLYAWENSFMDRIWCYRKQELKLLKKTSNFEALQSFFWTCTPFMVSLTSFTVYLNIDSSNVLTAEKAFVSISLFNLLKFPLVMLPSLFNSLIMSYVSMKRLNKFLNEDELVCYVTRHEESEAITIEHGNLTWKSVRDETTNPGSKTSNDDGQQSQQQQNQHYMEPVLRDINLHIKPGSFIAIVGQVASGKSSLISAILGEMDRISGRFNIKKDASIAYVPQSAWIQNMSVRDNILFGSDYDKSKYNQVISVCALQQDLDSFPSGDMSEVGESGLNLSGGQKQRVSLARAVYSDSDIYLLDDPLSALDSHIAKHVYDNVLSSSTGLLRNKTRVLATNMLFMLPHVDHIVVLDGGKIVESGTYDQLMAIKDGRFAETLRERTNQKQFEEQQLQPVSAKTSIASSVNLSDPQATRALASTQTASSSVQSLNNTGTVEQRLTHRTMSLVESVYSDIAPSSINTEDEHYVGRLIQVERIQTGGVNYRVYLDYFKSVSFGWVFAVCLLLISSSSFNVGANLCLSKLNSRSKVGQSDDNWELNGVDDEVKPTQSTAYIKSLLIIYALLGTMHCLSTLFATLSLARATVRGSLKLHSQLLTSVMHSPTTTFFDVTPIGRIVNRFAKDIDVIDTTLPASFKSSFECLLGVLSTLFVICYSFLSFLFIVVPMAILYNFIQRIFIVTSRQLKRLESITRSPIYSNFSETLSGIMVIRAFGCEPRFVKAADDLLDINHSCFYPNVVANRWLSVRLEFIGNSLSCLAGIFSVLNKGSIEPGLVGLPLSYSIAITQTLGWLVRQSSELETNVVSVERIMEYAKNKREDDWVKESFCPKSGPRWLDKGTIKFEDYSTRYRPGTELVLRNISLSVKDGEKVGIVGRTGSGKTSLSLALFRILEPSSGRIVVDGEDITKCGLHDLRSKLTIIPQDSVLFSGSLRFNLDPLSLYSDEQIWRALELSHLKSHVTALIDGLDFGVAEYGSNFSHGQRQLVCLARAVLRNSKIIVLDEATASVDIETDQLIQKTIRKEFKHSTILTIAHRLETILDSNKILVLDNGRVKELDTPHALANKENSIFASMLKAADIHVSKLHGKAD